MIPSGHTAVMARRTEPHDSLDFFPTPPWAARALCELLAARTGPLGRLSAWEPACGEGHIAGPLGEYFRHVYATDVHDYGTDVQDRVVDFLLGWSWPPHIAGKPYDWVITNPPFRLALDFALMGLATARRGVALLVRTAWLEGGTRYTDLFAKHPPAVIAQFAERVAMTKGRWDPDASTATAYLWVIWDNQAEGETRFVHIPPGRRVALTKPGDAARYGAVAVAEDGGEDDLQGALL